jgi:hypothetical protein
MIQTIKYKSFQISTVILSYLVGATPLLAQSSVGQSIQLRNPLAVTSIEELLVAILNILIIIAIPLIVFYIIYAGFLYVTARGNAQQVEQATRALTYAIIGGVLIIGAVAISEIVKNLVGSFTANP